MKLLLQADIPKLGDFGDVVEVSRGYGRNYLLPQRLAIEPTEENIKAIAHERARQAEIRKLARAGLQKVADHVRGAEITMIALANEQGHLFGSIGEKDIARALQDKNFEIQSKQVKITEALRELGEFEIELDFGHDIESRIQLKIIRQEEVDDASREESDPAEA